GQPGVDAAAVVAEHVGLAVHQPVGANHLGAERGTDRLVAEADAEDRQLAGEGADRVDADARLGRRARPGRQDDRVGCERADAVDVDLVVAKHAHVFSQLAEVLDEIEREAVVVVDHQEHQKPSSTSSAARNKARAFASVSFHSSSGTESATTPADACTCSWPSLTMPVRIAIATSMSPA